MIEPEVLGAFIRSSKEERDKFWKSLEDYCIANGLETSFYCPYVPLQTVGIAGEHKPAQVKFRTRYSIED